MLMRLFPRVFAIGPYHAMQCAFFSKTQTTNDTDIAWYKRCPIHHLTNHTGGLGRPSHFTGYDNTCVSARECTYNMSEILAIACSNNEKLLPSPANSAVAAADP